MTDQVPDALFAEHPSIDFGSLQLYHIIQGDPRLDHGWGDGLFPLPVATAPYFNGPTCLHRGYVATFVLKADGRLELRSFCRPVPGQAPRDEDVRIHLEGDFWLVMKPTFRGMRTYVPFKDGRIVTDRTQWLEETKEWEAAWRQR
jgi:hypothetical protein